MKELLCAFYLENTGRALRPSPVAGGVVGRAARGRGAQMPVDVTMLDCGGSRSLVVVCVEAEVKNPLVARWRRGGLGGLARGVGGFDLGLGGLAHDG